MINIYETSGQETFINRPKHGFLYYIFSTFQTIVLIAVLLGIWATASYLYKDYNDYIDIVYRCEIDINKDILRGNKATIVKALEAIKDEDSEAYDKVCKNVKTIAESYCFRSDTDSPDIFEIATPGCYIKGSGTIFIRPEAEDTSEIVNLRKQLILKYTDVLISYEKPF